MLHSLVTPPGLDEMAGLVFYVLSDPHLFIGSTTVMTTCLVIVAALLAAAAWLLPRRAPGRFSERALRWGAPRLALALAWFGVGSMILATEILLRFHTLDPYATTMQFRSGIGHLAVAVAGVVALARWLRPLGGKAWVEAHFWALGYIAFHVVVLTPPWFEYQFQGELVNAVARASLAVALIANLAAWRRLRAA